MCDDNRMMDSVDMLLAQAYTQAMDELVIQRSMMQKEKENIELKKNFETDDNQSKKIYYQNIGGLSNEG